MIPKIIHFVWFDDSPIPDRGAENIEEFRRLNPDHEIRLHTDDSELLDRLRPKYEQFANNPVTRCDFLRWCLLYKYGGWYFDVDCTPKVPVEVIEKEYNITNQVLYTLRGKWPECDILCCPGPEWSRWEDVLGYFETYSAQGTIVEYARIMLTRILDCSRGKGGHHDFIQADFKHFSSVLRDGIEPFILRTEERLYREIAQQRKEKEEQQTKNHLYNRHENPSFLKRLTNFTVALAEHVKNGSPTCSQEVINERLAICAKCSYFNGVACRHKNCGCNVNKQKKFFNKLSWADQKCPDDPPRWDKVEINVGEAS